MNKFLKSLIALSLIITISWCNNQEQVNSSDDIINKEETIKIWFVWPLTWDAASYWTQDKEVIEFFLEKNPKFGWKKVEIIYEDWQCNGQMATSAAQKLISSNKVQIILWWICSWETLAIAPLANKNKVLLFSSMSTSPEITNAWDYVFRNAPSDERSSDIMTDILSKKYKKIAIISQNNDFAQWYRAKLKEKLPKAWIEIVVDEVFNTWNTDFKTTINNVKESEAQALINLAWEPAPSWFINKQSFELGLNLPIYWTDAQNWTEFFDIAKNSAEWTIIVMTSANKKIDWVKEFFQEFKEKKWHDPVADAYALLTIDRLNILDKAIREVWNNWEKLKDWLYDMPAYNWLWWVTKFDKNWDSSIVPNVLIAKDWKYILKAE